MKTNDLVLIESYENIQKDVAVNCGRRLTNKEFENMYERVGSHLSDLIIEEADRVISFSRLKRRMRGAEKNDYYYIVYFKNSNAFQNDFIKKGSFKSKYDAKQFIEYKDAEPFDQWKITKVVRGEESDVVENLNEF